jgi:succinate-acetate transporter protein
MNPTEEQVRPPATRTVVRVLIAGGVVGWLVYATVLTAMTLRLPRPLEMLAGAVVVCLLVLAAAAAWRRIARNL